MRDVTCKYIPILIRFIKDEARKGNTGAIKTLREWDKARGIKK